MHFILKIVSIIVLHIGWFFTFILAVASTQCTQPTKGISYFLLEPICMFGLLPIIVYVIIHFLIKSVPDKSMRQKRISVIVCAICTVTVYILLLWDYLPRMIDKGFQFLFFEQYWM